MFDAIAFRYDFINRVFSLRRDVAWRKAIATAMPQREGLRVLDLATGTGDALLAAQAGRRHTQMIGADVSREMLLLAQTKISCAGYASGSVLIQTDAAALCCRDGVFDAVTVAFGARNFSEFETGLREIFRVLRPGGLVIILEFSLPANPMIRAAYLFYFRHIMPRLAGLISRQPDAYRYLNRTVEAFPYGQAFCGILRKVGFENSKAQSLTFGIATLYIGLKPG